MNLAKILVVDDEPQIRRTLRTVLIQQGYVVREAKSGEEALDEIRREMPELILLDWNMPGMSGLETCRLVRDSSDVAIIILTVRNAEKDKVEALDAGADDYIAKPFGTPELLARIRAALRRLPVSPDAMPAALRLPDLSVDFEARRVLARGREVRLTPKEYDLLRFLVAQAGKPVPHRKLLQTIWGPDYGDEVEYLRVFINHLRKKIEPELSKPRYILTEPWVGYRFAPYDPDQQLP
jgi:two-component system KDP operon response regulator KdpE